MAKDKHLHKKGDTEQLEAVVQQAEHNINKHESEYRALFNALDMNNDGVILKSRLLRLLTRMGILADDPRLYLGGAVQKNNTIAEHHPDDLAERIDFEQFQQIVQLSTGSIIKDAIQANMVIPDFEDFTSEIQHIFQKTKHVQDGAVATYIPQLGRVNPELYGVSVCTINGQRASFGDTNVSFCVQSVCKPINYCIALQQHGESVVHTHIGREPSGIGFNGLVLNSEGLPHNPMINSGAIMSCSLISNDSDIASRFDTVVDYWTRLAGGLRAGFNNSVYLSERSTADRNFALGYFMKENKAFPKDTDLVETLEFYFQCCSIEQTCESMSIVAATLANAGVCPLTGERIFSPDIVKNCLSLMSSCGMYDFSGEFAFTIGLPAKSGVSGAIMVIVPNTAGFCIYSPKLDKLGNSVRGLAFCKELVSTYNFHTFDSLTVGLNKKKDPRQRRNEATISYIVRLCWAASEGDLSEIQNIVAQGIDLNSADYDGRTALHLAASEGHLHIIEYLIAQQVNLSPKDRWGGTPLSDATKGNHTALAQLLRQHGAE